MIARFDPELVAVFGGLLALLVAAGVARTTASILGPVSEHLMQLVAAALLRKNLLSRLLEHPGAQALPSSAGEAISRFRDDIEHIVGFLTWTADPVGQLLVISASAAVLAQVNPWYTLAVFLPLAVTFLAVNMASRRIRAARDRNQQTANTLNQLGLPEFFAAEAYVTTRTMP